MHETHNPDGQTDSPAERRATLGALTHWRRSRRDKLVPTLMDLDLSVPQMSASSWFLLKEDDDPSRSTFLMCGDMAQKALGTNPKALTLSEVLPEAIREVLCGICVKAIHERAHFEFDGAFDGVLGLEIRYRSIFMPVDGSDGRYVFGAYRSQPRGIRRHSDPLGGYVFGAYSAKRFANRLSRSVEAPVA